jgi:integrase
MASIGVRGDRLFFDFRYKGQRCREQTALKDTSANRKRAEKALERIQAEITVGMFDYSKHFPESTMAQRFVKQATAVSDTPLFKEFIWEWFEDMRPTWRQSYVKTLKHVIEKRLIDEFGEVEVGHITRTQLLKFRAKLAKATLGTGKNLSPSYINRHMKIMRMVLNEAADRYEFTTPYVRIKPMKVQKSDIRPFSLDEVNLIIRNVRDDFKNYYTVRFFTGLRAGEISGLRWEHIDFERRLILVRESYLNGHLDYTKNDGSQRDIEMSSLVFDALQKQRLTTGQEGNERYVFQNSWGGPLDDHNVRARVWKPILALLDIRYRNPYQTRHTSATLWIAAGENPLWIARQMGHANTEMLFRVYSRYVPNLTRQDGSAMERLLQQSAISDPDQSKPVSKPDGGIQQ